jgi:hypothetical protein
MISSSTTYGALDKILKRLNFERKSAPDGQYVYFNRECDVLLVVPQANPNEKAWGPHLLTAQKMIVMKGVATEEKLEAVIHSVAKETEQAAQNGVLDVHAAAK